MVCSFSMLKQTKFKYLATFYKPKKKKIEQTNLLFSQKTNKNWNKVTTTQQKTQKTNNIYTESTTY